MIRSLASLASPQERCVWQDRWKICAGIAADASRQPTSLWRAQSNPAHHTRDRGLGRATERLRLRLCYAPNRSCEPGPLRPAFQRARAPPPRSHTSRNVTFHSVGRRSPRRSSATAKASLGPPQASKVHFFDFTALVRCNRSAGDHVSLVLTIGIFHRGHGPDACRERAQGRRFARLPRSGQGPVLTNFVRKNFRCEMLSSVGRALRPVRPTFPDRANHGRSGGSPRGI